MKKINGDVKVYCLINSSTYNGDGNYQVVVGNLNEMAELGFDEEKIKKLSKMKVDSLCYTDFNGCYVIRIA